MTKEGGYGILNELSERAGAAIEMVSNKLRTKRERAEKKKIFRVREVKKL